MHKEANNVTRFDSMADLAANMVADDCLNNDDDMAWFGHITPTQAVNMLTTGDQSQVAKAQALMDKYEVNLSTIGAVMEQSVAGFAPCVPEYLGGSPESMYTMAEVENPMGALTVIVDPTTSSGVSAEQFRQRGVIILAAVMALAALRPVTLEMVAIMDCSSSNYFDNQGRKGKGGENNFCAIRVPINAAPLDLGSACYAISHIGFARRLMYGLTRKIYGAPLHWPNLPGVNMRKPRDPGTMRRTLELLGEDMDSCLMIPSLELNDTLLTKPDEWIRDVLTKHGQRQPA